MLIAAPVIGSNDCEQNDELAFAILHIPMKRGLITVSLGYLLSRVFFFFLGIRFLGFDKLPVFLQYLDPPLLKHELLASLYYSSFPPLYNLIVGVQLKLFGESPTAFLAWHILLGWALTLVLFALMTDLGIGSRLAACATLLYMVLPPVVLYENWLFYSYLETLLFTLTVWSMLRFARQPAWWWSGSLFASSTALALLNGRMMFYVLVIGLFLWWHWRQSGKAAGMVRTILISALPLLLVVAVMAKNAWLFGTFTVDPHFGFHMGNGLIYSTWDDPETHAVCERDYPILLMPPTEFPPPEKVGLEPPARTGIALLDDLKRSGGAPNFNNRYYLEVSKMYSDAIKDFVTHHPRLYAKFVGRALVNYWEPSDHYLFFPKQNLQTLGSYDSLYDEVYPAFYCFYFAGLVYALYVSARSRWGDATTLTLGFAVATVAYSMLAIFVTYGENDRYKFTVEPLLWVMVVGMIQKTLHNAAKPSTNGSKTKPA